jgi:hypothetical protein
MSMVAGHPPNGRSRRRVLWWLGGAAGVFVLVEAGYLIVAANGLPTSIPSCSWSLRVSGHATSDQAGLVRCYLRALADHDTGGLLAVADTLSGPVRITSADFRHSADARTGVATATFTRGENDDAYLVTIKFADHAREDLAMGLANPGSVHSWRLGVGTPANSGGGQSEPSLVNP